MASLNKVMLIGNAGKDADLRYMSNGTAKAEFSLAVNNRRRTASGETEDQTEWFNIVLFAETAERLAQYITKGKPLYIEGRLATHSWEDDAGVKRYRTEVIANGVQLLGVRDDGRDRPPDAVYVGAAESKGSGRAPGPYQQRQQAAADLAGVDLDDLPFQ